MLGMVAVSPEVVDVRSGPLTLRAQVWRPSGSGPFPAVLFNHGSYSTADPLPAADPETLGSVFARHGYLFVWLHREGTGLSSDQGVSAGDQMTRARQAGGSDARNRVQLQLLDHEEMNEATAALARLRARGDVDAGRIGLVGHSFGGSLSVLMAARDPTIRAVVIFGGAAGSWNQSPGLRDAPPRRGGTPLGARTLHSCRKRLLDGARPGACDRDATAWKTLGGEDLSAVRRGRARRTQSHLRIGGHVGIGCLRVSGCTPATGSKLNARSGSVRARR